MLQIERRPRGHARVEMTAGVEIDRIENQSTRLGALFKTMAAVNISGVYLACRGRVGSCSTSKKMSA
ncbi:hypothetical protein PF011_g18763 [Phytophthora fragariae]|uniref:Uncharacterized protein n=1 Tax=Phytophthora fragariae TaxID=53985 RepID=A0A6A3J6S1_9STRA|nr:hypothetical protein PF011_g18763 [Phytophthora fragariae]KAE9313333.1 hypothetical protein PF008_g19757 [Phytophthora fragariae]